MTAMIKNFRNLLVAATLVVGASVATQINAQEQSDRDPDKKSKTEDSQSTPVPVLMLVPIEISADMEKKGCWVKFYEREGFRGDSLTLMGPINLSRLIGPFGADWENKVRSLKTGPTANLTIYDNRDFRDQNKFIGVNVFVPDMSERMGFFDDFRSIMLSCT
ncbi:MAG: hypothetical protein H0X43_06810 [Nitrosospira sp.]|nr:hypothetical protein [Nitrosospira sp.]